MKDVAKNAGVSVATVSYVLNNGPRPVTEETRTHVLAVMKKLGYQPNASARRLRRQHNHVLGVALAGLSTRPGISDLYFLDIISGISIAANEHHYDLMVFSDHEKLGSAEFYQSMAAQHMIDGLIAAGSTINPEGINIMNDAGTPAVLVGRQRSGPLVQRVVYSYAEDARWATQFFIQQGHRRVGLFLNLLSMVGEPERLMGYRAALEANGLPFDPGLVSIAPHVTQHPSREEVAGLLHSAVPDAIITAPYVEVCNFLDELKASPELGVITLDEESHLPHLPRIVGAVRPAKYEAGQKAVEVIIARIQGETETPEETVLASKYVVYQVQPFPQV